MIARACRIYDKTSKRMLYPKDLASMGVFLTVAGDPVQLKGGVTIAKLQNVVVMYETGMNTDDGHKIWDGDIIDADAITEFGSLVPVRGYMTWDKFNGRWYLHIPQPPALVGGSDFGVQSKAVVGNIYEHSEMLKPVPVSRETS